MTRDEFNAMVNVELDRLETEKKEAQTRVDYFDALDRKHRGDGQLHELKDAKFALDVVNKKIMRIKNLVEFPLYARIQAMSDLELEEYKAEKISEIELKIRKEEIKLRESKESFERLALEREGLINSFGRLFGEERDVAILKGQQIESELKANDPKNPESLFSKITKEIERLKNEIEVLKGKSLQDVKAELSSAIKDTNNRSFDNTVKTNELAINDYDRMLASVSNNPEAARKMSGLISQYRRLNDEKSKIKAKLFLPIGVPKSLQSELRGDKAYVKYYDAEKQETSNPDKLMEIVEKHEKSFRRDKDEFLSEFSNQKMEKLAGKELGTNSREVDLPFLEMHAGKIKPDMLEALKITLQERDQFSRKIFKSSSVKYQIIELDKEIRSLQSVIYQAISSWYKTKYNELLETDYGLELYSVESINNSINKLNGKIADKEDTYTTLKTRIDEARKEMSRMENDLETRKTDVLSSVRELAGPEFKEVEIGVYGSPNFSNIQESIVNAAGTVHHEQVVTDVLSEAKVQGELKESEIQKNKGFIDDLKEMRREALNMVAQEGQNLEEPNPGMSR